MTNPGLRTVVLGIRSHTGWAAVVSLAGPTASPKVVAKRRIDMATTFDEGAVYHKGQDLSVQEAASLIRTSEDKFEHTAREALIALVAELRRSGSEPVASALISGSGKPLAPLASILKSHALVHAAEGDLYRRVLLRACEGCGLGVLPVPEKDLEERAATALGIRPAQIPARLAALGKASGKPWTKDQKESALAAWIALAGHERSAS